MRVKVRSSPIDARIQNPPILPKIDWQCLTSTVNPLYTRCTQLMHPHCIPLYRAPLLLCTTLDSTVPTHWLALYPNIHHCRGYWQTLYSTVIMFKQWIEELLTSFKMHTCIWDQNLDLIWFSPIAYKKEIVLLFFKFFITCAVRNFSRGGGRVSMFSRKGKGYDLFWIIVLSK